jgi:hypothetical protein
VIGTQQYRRMENNSTNVLKDKESTDIVTAGKTRERETNAPDQFKAPQAAEGRETNAPCQRETAKNMGTRETNVSEKEAAAVRRDGGPLTIADQQLRQEDSGASRPPSQAQRRAATETAPHTAGPDPGEGAKIGGCRPNIVDISRAGTPASQASRSGSASRRRCLRRQLTQMLREGSECFNPDDVRRIIRAARAGLEGSLTAICMLDDDISLFTHAFPDADDKELRAHCLSTLLEYEESMQTWEEAKNSGELDSDDSGSEDEDELTGSELLRDLDPPAPCLPADTIPAARSGRLEWPKKILQQTNLVSSIAAKIELNINRANWDTDCYEGCRKLLQRETQRMGTVSDDRGPEEIPVLVRRETAKNMGTRETNVSEREAAAVRRDGGRPTNADQQLRQEDSGASRPPSQAQRGAATEAAPHTADPDPGEGAKTRGCRPNIIDISRAGTPASQVSRSGSASRRRCLRRQLTQMLREGSECFNPDDVRRIIRAARAGLEGSLTAICMLDDDISLFTHAFPDADDKELRAHCLSTLLEYEESMQTWEEAKNSGELDSDDSGSEDEDELTGSELLRDLDPPAP